MIPNPCCCNCTYFAAVESSAGAGESLFSDALGVTLTVDTGTWDIDGGGRLRVTGTGRIIIETTQPDSQPLYALGFVSDYTSTTISNDKDTVVKLYLDWIDSNNHHYAEGYPGLQTASVGPNPAPGKVAKVLAGAETVLRDERIAFFLGATNPPNTIQGHICIQNNTVNAGNQFPGAIVVLPSSPVGGYKAAIEIIQDAGLTFTFESISAFRMNSAGSCGAVTCGMCFAIQGCLTIPDNGFLVTISGVAAGVGGGACNNPGNYNGSFTCDDYGTWVADGWRSAAFALSPGITCGASNFTHGRVLLQPYLNYAGAEDASPECGTRFKVLLLATNFPASEDPSLWAQVGELSPDTFTDHEVDWICENLSGAEYSGGGSTNPYDTTSASFIVDAL